MNYVLSVLFIIILFCYKKQGFKTLETTHEFIRANSYDISRYASNTYPCANGNKPKQHYLP